MSVWSRVKVMRRELEAGVCEGFVVFSRCQGYKRVSLIASQPFREQQYHHSSGWGAAEKNKVEEAPNIFTIFIILWILYSAHNRFKYFGGKLSVESVLSCSGSVRAPAEGFWCLMWNEVDLIWENQESDTPVLQLSQEREKWRHVSVCVRRQSKRAANKLLTHCCSHQHSTQSSFIFLIVSNRLLWF